MRTSDSIRVDGVIDSFIQTDWVVRDGGWLYWRVIGKFSMNINVHEESYAGRDVRQWRLRFAAAQVRAREAIEGAAFGEWPVRI